MVVPTGAVGCEGRDRRLLFGGGLVMGPGLPNLQFVVLLLAGAFAAYIAHVHPASSEPLLVAVGVVTVLYLLLGSGGGTLR
ncbi:hypothetical protein [Streptomyces sp. NPDC056191]|uniref:hypothetical protein n=1 Tax=Streptomyces sp. NPDC056191 TaxID=3345742 RepID=UPI0035DF5F16